VGRWHRFVAGGAVLLVGGVGYGVADAASSVREAPRSVGVVVKATYVPPSVDVAVGGTVTWTFDDGDTPHTVTADDNSFGSPPNGQTKGTFEHVFPKAGSVKYHCDLHPDMIGAVNVR
jgi:plastocyanin